MGTTNVEAFLITLPPVEHELASRLRAIILDAAPECDERLSYGVPYYYGFRRICFVWPGSVPWGGLRSRGVKLGFCYGSEFAAESELLEMGGRKQVATATFVSAADIDEVEIFRCVTIAVDCDRRIRETSLRLRADGS